MYCVRRMYDPALTCSTVPSLFAAYGRAMRCPASECRPLSSTLTSLPSAGVLRTLGPCAYRPTPFRHVRHVHGSGIAMYGTAVILVMSGTDLVYADTTSFLRLRVTPADFASEGTICLRACYAMSGTHQRVMLSLVSAYVLAMQSPVLTQRIMLSLVHPYGVPCDVRY
eukprot:1361791-Rhodomonas_salina.9